MYRGRGSFNNNNRGGRGGYSGNNSAHTLQHANEFVNQNMITVEIQGWNNAPQQDIVNFLSRKVRIYLQNTRVDPSGRLLQGQVKTKREADDLVKCTGLKFAGQTLHIRIVDDLGMGNNPSSATNTIELLKNFLLSRYNPQIKMLDLQNLQNDPTLVQNGLFDSANLTSKFFPALMKVASTQKLDVESVNLSNNNIDDHSKWLSELGLQFPDVKNIALANNNIKKVDFFDRLKNKFNSLRELIITNNPLAQDFPSVQKIISFFPRLVMIDGNQVRDESKIASILTFPVKSTNMFFETEELSKIATNFLSSYFNYWDTNRTELISLYSPQSQFSFQCDSSVITDYNANSSGDLWNNYTPQSRNLKRVSNEKSRMARLFIGPEHILAAFKCLPKSRHSLAINPNDYAIETISFPALGGMMITIHGDFDEVDQPEQQFQDSTNKSFNNNSRYRNNSRNSFRKGILEKRGFDRTFIVVPGPNGAFIVASDMLCVKQYSNRKPWHHSDLQQFLPVASVPSALPTTSSTPLNLISGVNSSSSVLPPDVVARLNSTQQQLVLKVMQETRLKLEFALMLCEQSNWDYNIAGQNFANSKSQIPPDAYV
ncbi:hypothetical protein CANINC_003797 [Pichia inconspicua]|uniref:mRNA export factor MEX67 n=1 Tax=Pichia inconspicua TaxID=52247 RepID=A0A4T0WYZ4_9ASCO|nr:hypothetical protein CANINC_003797 [[Candida] inconspicua]